MLTFLVIVIIVLLLFGKEIKELLTYGIFFVIAYGLWHTAWWGKIIAVILVIGIFYNILEGLITPIVEFFKKRKQKKQQNEDVAN